MKTKLRKLLPQLLCLVMLIGLMPITAFAGVNVEEADVSILHPVHLANPDNYAQIYNGTCRINTTINSNGYINGVRWKDLRTGQYMTGSDTFVGGRDYELSLRLITKDGYNFSDTKTVITVNMDAANLVVNDLNHATVTITLIADELYINYTDVVGVNYPEIDDTPDTTIGTDDDNCTILDPTWTDLADGSKLSVNAKFKAGHAYKLSFTLFAKNGYIFPKNASVFVSGKLATLKRNSDYELEVSVEYPTLEEKIPEHTHSPSEWRTTGVYHYKTCTTCGELLDQEDHVGGVATCAEKGKCTVCGYEYIDVHENHTPDTTQWIDRGDMYHYHACQLCGAHCDIGEHVAGPAGTPDAAVVCRDCGYILAPAQSHEHSLTKVAKKDATCTEPGNVEYYACSGCSELFSDSEGQQKIIDTELAPLGHKASDDWKCNEQTHWRTCSVCGIPMTETEMVHEMQSGKCITCGKDAAPDANEPTEPGSSQPQEDDQPQEDGGSKWWISVLVGLLAMAMGAGIAFVFMKRKEKQ